MYALQKAVTFAAMENSKVVLIIQDGWGVTINQEVSAIAAADTPFHDSSMTARPSTTMEASGLAVGLPEGQMGNSEVGHMNIGAGRIVYQDLVKINLAIESGEIQDLEAWKKLIAYCQTNQKPLHLLGLLSDGGVHSSIDHVAGIIKLLASQNLPAVYLHVFTDGRDTSPTGGAEYIRSISNTMKETGVGEIASVIGRYFSMDRDKRWERVRKSYNLLVKGEGTPTTD
ncbi:MAG: 2,3-bisphosphoglycerate-independent phosphoglycerate mutase, partial [Bacteroidota bacterium]